MYGAALPLQSLVPAIAPKDVPRTNGSINLVTSDDFKQWYSQVPPLTQEILDARKVVYDKNIQDEMDLLQNQPVCPAVKPADPRMKLDRTNMKQMEALIGGEYYNPEVMSAALCSIEGLVYLAASQQAYHKIRRWLGKLSVIGEPSVNGTAMAAGSALVVKVSNAPNEDLVHEYMVGVKCLNDLRAMNILNFAYVLGAFRCSPPLPFGGTEDKGIASYCEGKKRIQYIIYENVQPSFSMRKYVATAEPVKFLDKYMQVILALRAAFLQYDFTHYDLHPGNVLIRVVKGMGGASNDDTIVLPYPKKGGVVYIKTGGIATLIDYGSSHVRYQGRSYGNNQYIEFGVRHDLSFPMNDAYRLMLGCASEAFQGSNQGVVKICERIFRFFNRTEPFMDALIKQGTYYNSLPGLPQLMNIGYDDLIKYMEVEFAPELATFMTTSPPPGVPIMLCSPGGNQVCLSAADIRNRLGAWDAPPKTLFDINENGPRGVSLDLYRELERSHREDADVLNKTYTAVGTPTHWLRVADVGVDPQLGQNFLIQIDHLVKQFDIAFQLRRHVIAGMNVASQYSDGMTVDYYRRIWEAFSQINLPNLKSRVRLAIDDYTTLNNIFTTYTRTVKTVPGGAGGAGGDAGSAVQIIYTDRRGQHVQSVLLNLMDQYRTSSYLDMFSTVANSPIW